MNKIIFIFQILLLTITKIQANYSCNSSSCNGPSCTCAAKSPPGGISPQDAPQFIIISFDDAVNSVTNEITEKMYRGIAHSSGCPVVATHFVHNIYTNYHIVQQVHAKGDEIALHTFNHTPLASLQEIKSGKQALSTYAGIPENDIKGFRAPFLNYTNELIQHIQDLGLTYDSSAPTILQDSNWPYTLDNGFSDDIDCQTTNTCGTIAPHNGLWEIELYSIFYGDNMPPISMDPAYDDGKLMDVLKANFNFRYDGNRQPMALALHAVHCNEPEEKVKLFRDFIKWCLTHKDVYFVTYSQLIEYMKNPVKASDLDGHPAVDCSKFETYKTDLDHEICDGIDNNKDGNIDEGLVENCSVGNSYFSTCFGCPSSEPSIQNPTPNHAADRKIIPSEGCSKGTWDPISGQCVSTTNSDFLSNLDEEIISNDQSSTNTNNDSDSSSVAIFSTNIYMMIGLFVILLSTLYLN